MFRVFFTVFKKELIEIVRDKRALIASIIVPFILFPAIFCFVGRTMNRQIITSDDVINVYVEEVNGSEGSLTNYLKSTKKFNVILRDGIKKEWDKGEMALGLIIPEEFEYSLNLKSSPDVEVYYNENSENSVIASHILISYIEKFSNNIIKSRLTGYEISEDNYNEIIIIKKASSYGGEYSKKILATILPIILIIISIITPMAGAMDLGVREKERGTIEALLTTQAGRMSVLFGKFFAISTMAIITAVAAIEGLVFAITDRSGYILSERGLSFYLSNATLGTIGIVLILTIMLFGALELALSIYSKSIKEAQAYISPLVLIAFVPIIFTQSININYIPQRYFHIPLVNIVCIIKELAILEVNINHVVVVIIWLLVYIILSIALATIFFNKEEIVIRY